MLRLIMFFLIFFSSNIYAAEKVTVFAASSTADVLSEIGKAFEKESGIKVVNSFASSGSLARQVEAGAPADIFLSANTEWVDYLLDKKSCIQGSRKDILSNELVLITAKESKLEYKFLPSDTKQTPLPLKKGRLAVGDPDHVPAGSYARQSLTTLGLWDDLKDNLARGENARVVLALVSRGEVPLGIVFATDAVAAKGAVKQLDYLPKDSYDKAVYSICTVADSKNKNTEKFITFLKSPTADNIFQKYGFTVIK